MPGRSLANGGIVTTGGLSSVTGRGMAMRRGWRWRLIEQRAASRKDARDARRARAESLAEARSPRSEVQRL